jgi:paired small multidrug resistance pump
MIALRVGSGISLDPWSAKVVLLPFGAVTLKWLPLPASKVTPWAFNHRLNSLNFITSPRCLDESTLQQICVNTAKMLYLVWPFSGPRCERLLFLNHAQSESKAWSYYSACSKNSTGHSPDFWGAITANFWHRDDLVDRKAWAIVIFSGAVCAHYLTGLISPYFGVVELRSVAGVGFLLGTFGASLIAAIIRAIKAADLWAFIRQRFGGCNPP